MPRHPTSTILLGFLPTSHRTIGRQPLAHVFAVRFAGLRPSLRRGGFFRATHRHFVERVFAEEGFVFVGFRRPIRVAARSRTGTREPLQESLICGF
ncbi:MAG: hypothetical protein AAF362_05225 [Pseudomonadota bacterium]